MKRYFLKEEDKQIRVTEWGERGKPVIFCLHGLGSTSLSFIEIAEQLKEDYRLIAIDAPGHGKTSAFPSGEQYEMDNMVDWLNNVIDQLDIDHFYFLSHSWGSFVALFYVRKFESRVRGSILIDGGYQTKRLAGQSMEEEVAYYEKDFDEYVFEDWEGFFSREKEAYTRWSPLLEKAVKDLGVERDNKVRWHMRGKDAGHIIRAMHKDETEDIYQSLSSNILLLRATLPERVEVQRKNTAETFQQKTGGTVKVVSNTTHMLHWDNPTIVVNEIKKYCNEGNR